MKYALRYLWRNKIATGINVSGLAVALSAAFLMLQYLDFELSYDTYLPEHDNVYRITTQTKNLHTNGTYHGVGDWIPGTLPEVEGVTRFYCWPANTGILLEYEGKLYNEKNYMYADNGFFKVFPSLLVAGPTTAIDEPNTIAISERLAIKLFGTTDVIGKMIVNPEQKDRVEKVTAVMRNIPANSHFDIDVLRPAEWIPDAEWAWKSTGWTYIRVAEGTDANELSAKLNRGVASLLREPATLSLQPLTTVHLQSKLDSEIKTPGSMIYINIIVAALILILVIAWINYVNLETARFIKRLKEVGIRRIIGSSKSRLLKRFLLEIFLVMFIATLLSVVVVVSIFPWFGDVTGLSLTTLSFSVPSMWIATAAGLVIATLIAGVYPFISLMNVNPISSLKGFTINRNPLTRNSLLAFQFTTSLTLMALVVMASLQLDFMRSMNTGFNTSSIITVYNPANYTWREQSSRKETNGAFRNRLAQIPSVTQMTTSSAIPGEPIGFTYTDLAKRSMTDLDRQIHYKVMYVDYNFVPLFGMELVAGRNYSAEFSDKFALVVNEAAVRDLGFSSSEEAVNQKIYFQEDDNGEDWDWHQWTIIGVVKDYRHESIKTPINPTILRLNRNTGQLVYYSFKVSDANALPAIEKIWKETWPGKPFDYFFMDQHYDQQYKSEIHFSRVFMLFSGVAVFIACLGVMGMSLFEANARIKEIGIRKVLGAEVTNILFLLTKGSIKTLMISLIVAVPLIYFLATGWLNTYHERIGLSAWFVIIPFALLLLLVLTTSITQILKTATRNPVDSLKHE